MPVPGDGGHERRRDEIDRRSVNVALIEHRLNELDRDLARGFVTLESKVDGNLEAIQARIEANAVRVQDQFDTLEERQEERATAVRKAQELLAEAMEKRVAALEAESNTRLVNLEKWRVEVEAALRTRHEMKEGGLKTIHVVLGTLGFLVAVAGLGITAIAVVVTVLLSG